MVRDGNGSLMAWSGLGWFGLLPVNNILARGHGFAISGSDILTRFTGKRMKRGLFCVEVSLAVQKSRFQ